MVAKAEEVKKNSKNKIWDRIEPIPETGKTAIAFAAREKRNRVKGKKNKSGSYGTGKQTNGKTWFHLLSSKFCMTFLSHLYFENVS